MRLPPYDTEKLCKGFVAGCVSAICFLLGLDSAIDPFRLFHGLSQAMVGFALYYLWQIVPLNSAMKKTDGARGGAHDDYELLHTPPHPSGARGAGGLSWSQPAGRGMGRVMSFDESTDARRLARIQQLYD